MEKQTKNQKTDSNLKISVFSIEGKHVNDASLPSDIFNAKMSPTTVQNYIRVYLNNQRRGTASTKTRSEVVGSTRKIYRQKGTGNARHGAKKAPIFVGGGITFGPKPKDHTVKLNKKQKKVALFSVLTSKYTEGKIFALNTDSYMIEPKTKMFANFIKNREIKDARMLIVTANGDKKNLHKSVRNIPSVKIMDTQSINPFYVVSAEYIVIMEDAIEQLQKHFTSNHES